MRQLFSLVLLLVIGLGQVQAKDYEACFQKAAKKHNVPVSLLFAVSFTESSFKPTARNKNRNGTRDYGLMQINSIWAKQAKKMGYSWQQIKSNPCTNIMFGSHILKANKKRLGSWRAAVGAYNAGFSKSAKAKKRRQRYYNKVIRNKGIAKRYLHRLKAKSS